MLYLLEDPGAARYQVLAAADGKSPEIYRHYKQNIDIVLIDGSSKNRSPMCCFR
jgi:hypothetical protein